MRKTTSRLHGFTIVELLIVVVVIAILAAISVVAYTNIQNRAQASVLSSDLVNAAKQLKIDHTYSGSYPATIAAANGGQGLPASTGTTFRYSVNNSASPQTFCLSAFKGSMFYMVTESTSPTEGSCVNVALGAVVTGAGSNAARLTDGDLNTNNWASATGPAVVDLGSAQDISMVKVWHYYGDSRSYYSSRTEISEDGTNWTTIFDSAVSGIYPETSAGRTHTFNAQKVRYIRDRVVGSTSNSGNHWVEIQAY
jgi:prepilin-type N-terminal cleavage/methylation domain-containing protein